MLKFKEFLKSEGWLDAARGAFSRPAAQVTNSAIPQQPQGVTLKRGTIDFMLDRINKTRQPGAKPRGIENLLLYFQKYAGITLDWAKFSEICMRYGINPQELAQKLSK